jgi:glucosamine--fructose-6-phosphate aminotransferase (isomerizing)
LLDTQSQPAATIAAAIRAFNPLFVCIAARGTSDNAARYAQYLWGIHLQLPVMLATPSIQTLYEGSVNLSRALVIGISQSGKAEDVRQVLADAKAQGALTLSITNDEQSPLAQFADYHLPLCAEEEISIAATKTYTAQLTALALLMTALKQDASLTAQLAQLPQWIESTLNATQGISQWAQRYRYMEHCVALGRGYNYCTAFEVNLKITELCYVTGHGYSEADFRHGPIAMTHSGFPMIVIAPSGKTLPNMLDLLTKLQDKQAECIVFSDDATACQSTPFHVVLPTGVPEWLTPMLAVLPGQVLALNIALVKGHSVDKPRGLSKVTVTK